MSIHFKDDELVIGNPFNYDIEGMKEDIYKSVGSIGKVGEKQSYRETWKTLTFARRQKLLDLKFLDLEKIKIQN